MVMYLDVQRLARDGVPGDSVRKVVVMLFLLSVLTSKAQAESAPTINSPRSSLEIVAPSEVTLADLTKGFEVSVVSYIGTKEALNLLANVQPTPESELGSISIQALPSSQETPRLRETRFKVVSAKAPQTSKGSLRISFVELQTKAATHAEITLVPQHFLTSVAAWETTLLSPTTDAIIPEIPLGEVASSETIPLGVLSSGSDTITVSIAKAADATSSPVLSVSGNLSPGKYAGPVKRLLGPDQKAVQLTVIIKDHWWIALLAIVIGVLVGTGYRYINEVKFRLARERSHVLAAEVAFGHVLDSLKTDPTLTLVVTQQRAALDQLAKRQREALLADLNRMGKGTGLSLDTSNPSFHAYSKKLETFRQEPEEVERYIRSLPELQTLITQFLLLPEGKTPPPGIAATVPPVLSDAQKLSPVGYSSVAELNEKGSLIMSTLRDLIWLAPLATLYSQQSSAGLQALRDLRKDHTHLPSDELNIISAQREFLAAEHAGLEVIWWMWKENYDGYLVHGLERQLEDARAALQRGRSLLRELQLDFANRKAAFTLVEVEASIEVPPVRPPRFEGGGGGGYVSPIAALQRSQRQILTLGIPLFIFSLLAAGLSGIETLWSNHEFGGALDWLRAFAWGFGTKLTVDNAVAAFGNLLKPFGDSRFPGMG
jgi:hypothetical protein